MNSLQEDAWLAGICEGEYAVFINKQRNAERKRLQSSIQMVDKDVIEKVMNVHPNKTGHISVRNSNTAPSTIRRRKLGITVKDCQLCYQIIWHGSEAESLVCRIEPYMGERRKEKIMECLNTPNLSHHPKAKV